MSDGDDPTVDWSPRVAVKDGETLPAGTVLDDRYRIVAKLDAGGMGTVYRADDLRLGQDVAIKFLSGNWQDDNAALGGLLREVRTARRVTHRNVCRVHDVGEVDGRPFLTMELVEGEDLGALARRIGRIPYQKALQIALQTGAGLQAAHDQGVIHRDLKPGNVMLDDRGDARITDFGIASTIGQGDEQHSAAGTPAYMAPELFRGGSPSIATDVFAFGALLYEVFTGRRPFRADKLDELLQSHQRPPASIAESVPEIEPRIDRVIRRCLSPEASDRPKTVLEVMSVLPGWDPVGDAIARGETPSPTAVAEGLGSGRLSQRRALWLGGGLLVALVLTALVTERVGLVANTQLPKAGPVLAEDARRHLDALGYAFDRESEHESWAFDFYQEMIRELLASTAGSDRWGWLGLRRPTAIDFYYRRSPVPFVPSWGSLRPAWEDPPIRVPGMVQVRLDPAGGLRELVAVPADTNRIREAPSAAAGPADWSVALKCADLDPALLREAEPLRVPQVFADHRAAWTGTYPESGVDIRVEAASLAGRVVSFRIVELELEAASQPPTEGDNENPRHSEELRAYDLFSVFVYIGTVLLAWHALRRDRADYRGATRLALFVFGLSSVATFCLAEHSSALSAELEVFASALSRGLIRGAAFWLLYVALEPHVRRASPEVLVSWTRLFSGRFRDHLVWSNVIAGVAVGVGVALLRLAHGALCVALDIPGPEPAHEDLVTAAALNGPVPAVGAVLQVTLRFLGFAMSAAMAMVLLKLIFRRKPWVILASVAVLTTVFASEHSALWLGIPVALIQAAACVFGVIRFGLLGFVVGASSYGILHGFPLTFDVDAWYVSSGLLAIAVLAGSVGYGIRTLRLA